MSLPFDGQSIYKHTDYLFPFLSSSTFLPLQKIRTHIYIYIRYNVHFNLATLHAT